MENRPLFLGRGRGRGRSAQQNRISENRHGASTWNKKAPGKPAIVEVGGGPSEERLKAADKIKESVQRYMADEFDDSSSDEEVNDTEILSTTLKSYENSSSHAKVDLQKTSQYLLESCRPGANVCLICIASIKHTDAIWNCSQCYCLLHLHCVQKWARDGAVHRSLLSQDDGEQVDRSWFCPKCRYEFKQNECPTKYYCFCAKQVDPLFDPWLVPHSCGQTCSRPLKPECGHDCLLLCHPGPCPPCPKTVHSRCHCGSSGPAIKRCSAREWSCGKPCGKLLSCGHHNCQSPCHAGDCAACPKESRQVCLCGKKSATRPCASPEWNCGQTCGKKLQCGHHTCERACHAGECGDCPRTGVRRCPCGKTSVALPCTEDIPTCGDTCNKDLACGRHQCTLRCHEGPCETCRQMITKTCRCGKREKSVPCSQEYLCESKCNNMRDCGRHACKKKCCNGHCPPCEQVCSRTLNCKNDKCPSQCHRGPCYPCPLTVVVKCFCAATSLTLPCGRERTTRPPKCSEKCKIPPDCHHDHRVPHHCHYGPCPPCRLPCKLQLKHCSHQCPEPCHDKVPQATGTDKPKVPIRSAVNQRSPEVEQLESKPCPPCRVPVERSCFGEHVVEKFPCSVVRPYSCKRECGRSLKCGNHTCQMECHVVSNAPSRHEAGEECAPCEEHCSRPRHPDCVHECLQPCHPGECEDCKQMVKQRCHCQLMTVYVQCSELTSAEDSTRGQLLSCKNQCPKNLPCGHRCTAICHPGSCPNPKQCGKKTTVRCNCRRRKKEFPCHVVQSGAASLECDEVCKTSLAESEKFETEAERAKREQELKAQQEELEWFERKQRGKKRRPRKQVEEIQQPSLFARHGRTAVLTAASVAVISALMYIATT